MPLCRCILSKFYIKPQLPIGSTDAVSSCILSKFYIKPQLERCMALREPRCILSKFYIKPQHLSRRAWPQQCCILSKFYIKPQLQGFSQRRKPVVSYRNSTSNHNSRAAGTISAGVVSYRNSTSNHNRPNIRRKVSTVVSYRNSTSNHNSCLCISEETALYLIEILHQTTTFRQEESLPQCCILSKFYIKPQHSKRHFVVLGVVSYRNSTSNHNPIL